MMGRMAAPDPIPTVKGRWVIRRSVPLPTWRGCIVILLMAGAALFLFVKTVHPFLAMQEPTSGGLLVVEGWLPDHALQEAWHEFETGRYQKLLVTGGPLERGSPLSGYATHAELGAAILLALGANSNSVVAIPASKVHRDRTYSYAVALRAYLDKNHLQQPVHLITMGPHARRSRLLYEKALGKGTPISVFAYDEREYDPAHWWRYSAGVRIVIGELLAYGYVKLFFRPESA
jgi:uncharacterized SAM-binding protein YcdF (DUF218 family)